MSIPELSVQIKNVPGQLVQITSVLAEAGINIRGITASSTGKVGWVRVGVDKAKQAQDALEDSGIDVEVGEALAVMLTDSPGALDRVLRILAYEKVNLDFIYTCLDRQGSRVMAVLGVQSPGKTETLLRKQGVECADFHG
jgi:hypothetical protein